VTEILQHNPPYRFRFQEIDFWMRKLIFASGQYILYFFEDTGGCLKTVHTKYDFPILVANPDLPRTNYGTTTSACTHVYVDLGHGPGPQPVA
jgi:hypothetical protein